MDAGQYGGFEAIIDDSTLIGGVHNVASSVVAKYSFTYCVDLGVFPLSNVLPYFSSFLELTRAPSKKPVDCNTAHFEINPGH